MRLFNGYLSIFMDTIAMLITLLFNCHAMLITLLFSFQMMAYPFLQVYWCLVCSWK